MEEKTSLSNFQSPWDLPDFEWDHKIPDWKHVCEMVIPQGCGTSYDNQTLFNAVKTKTGREALRFSLTVDSLKIEHPLYLDACEAALLQHHNYQNIHRKREVIETRKQKTAKMRADKLALRTKEREAAAEAKKSALYEKEVIRQEKARLREQKIAMAASRRIHAQMVKHEKNIRSNKKRKVEEASSDDSAGSTSSSSSAEDEDVDIVQVGATCDYFAIPDQPVLRRSVNVDYGTVF